MGWTGQGSISINGDYNSGFISCLTLLYLKTNPFAFVPSILIVTISLTIAVSQLCIGRYDFIANPVAVNIVKC